MSKHTPGPWDWQWATDFNGNADGRIFTAWNGHVGLAAPLCVAVSPRYQTKEQWEKDAPVLAAAPDMLAASILGLEAIDNILSSHEGQAEYQQLKSAFDALEAAIAKAEKRDAPIAGQRGD